MPMTIHVFEPPREAARRRVQAVQFQQLDRAIEAARREDALAKMRAEIRPRVLRARRRQALRRALDRAVACILSFIARRNS